MSTTDTASATHGMQHNDNIAPLSLPSFTSARDAQDLRPIRAESSTSGSRWRLGDRENHAPDLRASLSTRDTQTEERDQRLFSTSSRRNQNRGSGGFLLEPTTHSSRLSKTILSRSQNGATGKRKNDLSSITVAKRRNRQSTQEHEPSHQSSPLSVEVRQGQEDEYQNGQNNKETDLDSLDSIQKSADGQKDFSKTPTSQPSLRSSMENQNDTTQIVQMALKLSEGRRRQASAKRLVSGESQGKRVISSLSSHPVRTPTKSLGLYVVSSTPASGSPLPKSSLRNGTNEQDADPMVVDDPFSSPGADVSTTDLDAGIEISRATASRVEKAKIYLELAYEHRRLLSHLPPIATPTSLNRATSPVPDSKIYNPLQYARNRKLRIREKNAIDAEFEGWHEIEKVRAWVDAVIDSHAETSHDPLECVRLPPLSLDEDEDGEDRLDRIRTKTPGSGHDQNRPRRPKSDWVTHPADLLADAFWLEQGLNKTKIQDRDNNPIYPADTTFKFSGWRNRNPLDMSVQLQQIKVPPTEPSVEENPVPLAFAPTLPTFQSAHKKEKHQSPVAKRSKITNPLAMTHGNSRRWKPSHMDSSSDSDTDSDTSSIASNGENGFRRRGRVSHKFDLSDGDPFGPPTTSTYENSDMQKALTSSDATVLDRGSKRSSIDSSRISKYLKRNSVAKSVSHERGRSRGEKHRRHFLRHSKDSKTRGKSTKDTFEDDNIAPDAPVHYGLPSITIDLDTPVSRSPSPTKKDKSRVLQPWKDRSKRTDLDKVDTNDFAKGYDSPHSRGTSVDVGKGRDSSSHNTSRGTSPLTRGPSPFTKLRRESSAPDDGVISPLDQKSNPISRQSTRPLSVQLHDQPSKIRGIFKGGRIAELVGNEVSRVGDFIWKREVPPAYRHRKSKSGSEASFRTTDRSDTEEETQNGHLHRRHSRDLRHSISTQSSSGGRRSPEYARTNDKVQLHNPNLPSFTSPFQKDREREEKKQEIPTSSGLSDSDDHISRQVVHHRSSSRSPRLDLIAPPKLDTGAPRHFDAIEHTESSGPGPALPRSQGATRALNEALNAESSTNRSAKSPAAGPLDRVQTSVTEVPAINASKRIDRKEISRIEALLMISAVKARYISSSYDMIPAEQSQILRDHALQKNANRNLSDLQRIRDRDERVRTAGTLVEQLGRQNAQINDQLRGFSSTTVNQLHKRIQELEDQIENTITPRVRVAADNAGELSVKLTTTSTQAIKNLQDVISEAFRLRRRGPFRWVRFVWYTMIEWFVVSLLWFIWALVTLVRICLGLSKAVGKTVRWLLWID